MRIQSIYSKSNMGLKLSKGAILMALVVLAACGCQLNNQINDFYSARAIFELPADQSSSLAFSYQTYNITLPHRYDRNSAIQYAFALSEAGAVTGNVTYFDLLVLKTFDASLVVNFIYEPGKWVRASYNYWVAFRKDINLGVQSLSSAQLINSNGKYEVACLMRQTPVSNKAAALVFLSGMRFDTTNTTDGHKLSFAIGKQYVKDDQLIFSFSSATPLQISSLTFSFVVFDPHALPFASYGGTISSNSLASTASKDLRYILVASSTYSLYGISSIQADSSFSFTSILLNNLTLTYGVNEWQKLPHLELTYVVIGQTSANLCLRNPECQATGQLIISRQSCVSSCQAASKPVTHIDGAVECIPCPLNMAYSNATRKCVCPSGFTTKSNGSCLPQTQNNGVAYSRASSGDALLGASDSTSQCLKIVSVQSNNKNLFITIQAGKQVLLDPQSNSKNYIQLEFASGQPSSYYCSASNEDVTQYNCLALFTLGIPATTIITATCALSASGIPCSASYSYATAKNQ